MIESSGWGISRDEEIHKAAGNVQLRKYGQFFNNLAATWKEEISSFENLREGPLRLVYRLKDETDILSLVEMKNKSLSKILAAVAGTCREIRMLKSEANNFYIKLMVHGEAVTEPKSSQNFSKLFADLQDTSIYINRIFTVTHLAISQLSSLSRGPEEIYLPSLIEHTLDLFLILVTFDEIVESYPTLLDQWKSYRIQVRSVMHNPAKFSIPETRLSTLDKLLKDLQGHLLGKNLFSKGVEHSMDVSKTSNMNDQLVTYLKNTMAEVESKIANSYAVNKNWSRLNIGVVLSTRLFGVCDKKLVRRLGEANKRLYAVTLVGNVIWMPAKFLSESMPRDTVTPINSQIGEKLLATRIAKLPVAAGQIIGRAMLWCVEAKALLSSNDFQIKDIKKQCSLLKDIAEITAVIAEIISLLTNLHAHLQKAMTKSTVQIICRLVEVLKTLETTFNSLGPVVVQAQGRALQSLSYEILVILEAAKKGLIQKDQAYSRERLDALSLMRLSTRLMNGPATADRRLIVRCALAYARQLTDTFKDDEAVKLRRKLEDYDVLAELYTNISEVCDYSILLHYQTMIPAYLASIVGSNQDISHISHLLNALNSAIIRQDSPEIADARISELREMLVKNVLKPACREIETSLRLHVHSHLKLDSTNPFEIGAKDAGRIVASLPLPISNNLVSSKRFVEHYLDTTFYNLTTLALHDWKTYRTMHALASYKLSLDTVQNHLPTQTLEQGLDALEIMRNIHVFVSRYLYNMNTQTFIEQKSTSKYLNTIGIRHIANSIRTHGTGIMSTTVNFVYQFLCIKLHTFSQFMFDEHIKSRLLKDVKFVKVQRENESVPYTYERAEKFQKGIRKLGMSEDGMSYLDHFRQLITQIGNALGYVRLIRSGGLHACANAISFLPDVNSVTPFERKCVDLGYSENTQAAAKRLQNDIANLVENFNEGIHYFKLLVDVFASNFRDPKSRHLQQFYAIVPPLTLSFVDNALSNKEKILKKNKDGAAFTDDGFAMGIAYINALLDQNKELDGLQWFETVYRQAADERLAAESKNDAADEKLQQTRALTLKRLNERNAEFQLLDYSLSGARVFFKQPDT
ncbi:WASH complex subunit 4 [Venturia canescens]|uniref:WASH complex subunit 4 n=1 Tax=Venturia canescens TaxID=32260 RepID=UPI001C9BC877|nr:WASH complex subunit 4 [Venturia canescens]